MKKFIIVSLLGIFMLTAYGGMTKEVVKIKNDVSYSIVAPGEVVAGYVVEANLPQARTRESYSFTMQDLSFKFYGPEIWITENRSSWQDRSNRLWLKDSDTHYTAIAKPFKTPTLVNPPKIC